MILGEDNNSCVFKETIVEEVESTDRQEETRNEKWKFRFDEEILVGNEQPPLSLDGCVYRGEGNANVVVSIPNERKVVRFRKSCSLGEASPDGGRTRTIREVEFLKYVISGFLADFMEPPEALRVTRKDMIKMSEDIRSLRPEYRRVKEIAEEYVTMFTDYTFLPKRITNLLNKTCDKATFCVEIKPKQGFRHEMDEQFRKCTYCLTQYYKLKSGAIKSRSSYCPFDLFSGDTVRMKKSLRGLLDSPQNNLKIFKDGVVVYGSDSTLGELENVFAQWFSTRGPQTTEEYFETFFKLVVAALLRQFSSSSLRKMEARNYPLAGFALEDYEHRSRINQEIVDRARKILYFSGDQCNFVGNDLPAGSVLERILNMQQLPYHSTDIVYKIYSKHFASLNDDAVYSKMIRMYRGENKVSLSKVEKRNDFDDLTSSKSRRKMSDGNGNENKEMTENGLPVLDQRNNNEEMKSSISNQELQALENYLLVTTAKDCSILMAFQEIDSNDVVSATIEDHVVQATDRIKFLVNIGVLDLDPKTVHCVEKHRQRDTNVLVSLINLVERDTDYRNRSPFAPA